MLSSNVSLLDLQVNSIPLSLCSSALSVRNSGFLSRFHLQRWFPHDRRLNRLNVHRVDALKRFPSRLSLEIACRVNAA